MAGKIPTQPMRTGDWGMLTAAQGKHRVEAAIAGTTSFNHEGGRFSDRLAVKCASNKNVCQCCCVGFVVLKIRFPR
jgi:hypothetical protein